MTEKSQYCDPTQAAKAYIGTTYKLSRRYAGMSATLGLC